jgi:hypothetical protein
MPRNVRDEQAAMILLVATAALFAGQWSGADALWEPFFSAENASSGSRGRTTCVYLAWFVVLTLQAALLGWWGRKAAAEGLVVAGSFPVWDRMRQEYGSVRWRLAPGRMGEALRVLLNRGGKGAGAVAILVAVGPQRHCAVQIAGEVVAASTCLLHPRAWVRWSAYSVVIGAWSAILDVGEP